MPRVWVDGCFDLGHFGHANLLRKAQELAGPEGQVVVGIHCDEDIEQHKRKPIFSQKERIYMMESLKWSHEVVINVPYVTTIDVVKKHDCDFCIHGSDITSTAEGEDCYKEVKDANLYVEVPRTQGISTSKLINRVLKSESGTISSYTGSKFLLSSKMVTKFDCFDERKEGEVVIYVAGSFDLFHPGHVDFLRAARCHGDYLVVGIFDDETVRRLKGPSYPVMTLHERAMTVLGCRFVQEVIIGAPYTVTNELMTTFNINLVIHGNHPIEPDENGNDPFLEAAATGKNLLKVDSFNPLTTEDVVKRIKVRELELIKINEDKELKVSKIIQKLNSAQ